MLGLRFPNFIIMLFIFLYFFDVWTCDIIVIGFLTLRADMIGFIGISCWRTTVRVRVIMTVLRKIRICLSLMWYLRPMIVLCLFDEVTRKFFLHFSSVNLLNDLMSLNSLYWLGPMIRSFMLVDLFWQILFSLHSWILLFEILFVWWINFQFPLFPRLYIGVWGRNSWIIGMI